MGIIQVIPKLAAAPPISVPKVDDAEPNIEAGARMMRNIADTYFKDDKLDALNKTLMVFASYNAGPTSIARLRKKAANEGLWDKRPCSTRAISTNITSPTSRGARIDRSLAFPSFYGAKWGVLSRGTRSV